MDGNNRWSKINGISTYQSYNKGAKNLIQLTNKIFQNTNVKYITAFALSSNNLKRSKKIIEIIIKVLNLNLDQALDNKINFSISIKGDLKFLNNEIKKKIDLLKKKKLNFQKELIILINYSGKQDIIDTANKIYAANKNINLNNFHKYSIISNIPDPDLLIRTGGYNRISDFILFNISFTELFFLKKLWPDLRYSDVSRIINNFQKIERKFGL